MSYTYAALRYSVRLSSLTRATQNTREKFTVLTGSFSLQVFLSPRNFSSQVMFVWADIKGARTSDDHQLFLRSRVYMISAGSADSQLHSNNMPYLQTTTEDSASEAELQCALRCVPHTHTPHRSGAAVTLWPRSSAALHRCRGVERQIPAAQCFTGTVVLLGCGGYRNKAATVGVFRWLLSGCAVWMACGN